MDAPEKIWPVGLYAPGKYMCKCVKCGETHLADKRAQHCADCTIQALVAARAAHPVTVEMLERWADRCDDYLMLRIANEIHAAIAQMKDKP